MAHAPFTVRATQMTRFGGRPDEPLRSAPDRPSATASDIIHRAKDLQRPRRHCLRIRRLGGGVSASAPRPTAIAILPRLSPPKTLAVLHHGPGRDYRGRNGQRRRVTGAGRVRVLFEAGRLRRPEARDDGEGVAALVTI
jgi:hypothetical protein